MRDRATHPAAVKQSVKKRCCVTMSDEAAVLAAAKQEAEKEVEQPTADRESVAAAS